MSDPTLVEFYKDLEARVRVLERKSDLRVAVVASLTSVVVALIAALL